MIRSCQCHHHKILVCPVHEHDEWLATQGAVIMEYWSKGLKPVVDASTARKWVDEYDLGIIKNGIDAAHKFVCKRANTGMETTLYVR
jgi:hypothetical protein